MKIILGLCFVLQLQIIQKKSLTHLSDNFYLAYLTNYEGVEAGSTGYLKKAAEKFAHAQKLNPKDYACNLNMQIITDFKHGKINKTQTQQLFQAALHIIHTDYQQAEANLSELDKKLAEYIPVYIYQGINYLKWKKYDKGIKLLSIALKYKPEDPYILYLRAKLNHAVSFLSEAIRDYSDAIEIDSSYSEAYWGRGLVWRDLQDLQQSIMNFELALSLNPLYANLLEESLQLFEAYNNRGIIYLKEGHCHLAINDFKRAIVFNNQFSEPFINLGTAYRNLHEYDNALFYYMIAVNLDSVNPDVFLNRGIFYKEIKNYEMAVQDFQKVISIDPGNSEAYYNLGEVHFAQEDYEKAIYSFNKMIKIDKYNPWPHYWLALSYDNMKQWHKAIKSYQKFIDYSTEDYFEHRLKAAERIRRLKNWLLKKR